MLKETLKELFSRDLKKLKVEIDAYNDEQSMWLVSGIINNSGGNLCLHIIGNLKTYIGCGLAKIEYLRDREFEFSGKNVERSRLLKEIDETIDIVFQGLDNLSANMLNDNFPIIIWEEEKRMDFTLIHLHAHLNYHLGQINYHRRMLDK